MARIEEKIAVICNIGRSDHHNLHTAWSVVRDAVCSLTGITENPFMEKWS